MRTARSRTSGENLLDLFMAPSSQELGPPPNPGRFNLRGIDGGWLVFGVNNKTRRVVGTDYRPQSERLHSLKMQIAENAEPRITFREIHELEYADGRVLLFEIPAAPQGIPIA